MPQTLVVVHRLRSGNGSDLQNDQPCAIVFRTCLREIGFLRRMDLGPRGLAPGDQLFAAGEAYRFLLEVVCGLHSPLLGESEVLGQFKHFCLGTRKAQTGWSTFQNLCTRLLTDAKTVRSTHLTGVGSASYGRLVRRHVRFLPHVSILGAGRLAREILPHLAATERVEVFSRSREKSLALEEQYPHLEVRDLAEVTSNGRGSALVIAAPMTARALARWIAEGGRRFETILDLRGESDQDPLRLNGPSVLSLRFLFAELQLQRVADEARVSAARLQIARCVRDYAAREEVRPFGWEDLCA